MLTPVGNSAGSSRARDAWSNQPCRLPEPEPHNEVFLRAVPWLSDLWHFEPIEEALTDSPCALIVRVIETFAPVQLNSDARARVRIHLDQSSLRPWIAHRPILYHFLALFPGGLCSRPPPL